MKTRVEWERRDKSDYHQFATVEGVRVFVRFKFYGPPRRGGEWQYGEVDELGIPAVKGSNTLLMQARLNAEHLTWRM